jgi:dipeptidyl aminopeptidase/acylaminoacyl peptidase
MTIPARLQRAVIGALVASLGATTLAAQSTAAPTQNTATAGPSKGRLIMPADIKAWNTIRQTAISNDGKWFAYVVAPTEGNATLVVRGTARDAKETRIPVGENGGSIAISGDSRWIGYLVAPPRANPDSARGRAAGTGRGGPGGAGIRGGGPGGDSAATARPRANKFVVMNLATGEKKEFDRIRRFNFNADQATWVAMLGYPAGGGGAPEAAPGGVGRGGGPALGAGPENGGAGGGANLMLYNLASGELVNIGLVGEYSFNQSGEWLAYTMDTPDQVGNGVQLHNLKTNIIRSVDSDRQLYRHLAWADSSRALGVMRGKINETTRDTAFSIAAFTDFGASGPARKLIFDPAGREDFPSGWKIAFERAPRFAQGMTAVFFGIREIPRNPRPQIAAGRGTSPIQSGAPGAGGTVNQGRGGGAADSTTSLVLWHAKDPRLQSQQIVQEQADRSFNYLSEYRFADDRFFRLTTDSLRNITITPRERFAYGIDTRAYDQVASYSGRNYQDVYRIDLATGKSTLVMKKKPSIGGFSASPDGQKVLYWGKDGNFWVLDLASGDTVNITRGAPISFANREDDHNNIFPAPGRSLGWARDGSAVLVSDNWDVWKVPVKSGAAVNLTGDGRKNQIRYQRLYQFDSRGPQGVVFFGGFGGGSAEGIDLSKPLYIATYGEWTKKEGLSRVDPGQPGAKRIFFDEARFNIVRARDAETYLYTRQNFTEFPNWWVFGDGFKDGYQITDVNPQMKDLAWSSGTRLIDYTSDKGDKLQGALYLPANYEPGKKYPLLVTIYEKRSQNMRSFVNPSETRAPDPTLYTNRGYAVLDPDIVYRVNDPGMSAVWCVVPAVKAAIATGMIDPKNVGLWGHSWGGYQTAFLVTQTNIFTAAIAGAPLTDLVSMYSSVYWNTGGTNQAIFEASQGRFKGNFIDNYDAYIRNSPAFQAKNVQTPLIILHNDKDGAVDFNQGITYFNTLRQLGKDVILLEYVGENHGLARAPNQKDYAIRMSEWFDHHLMGAPVADWIANGVPRIRMDEHLQQRKDSTARVVIP